MLEWFLENGLKWLIGLLFSGLSLCVGKLWKSLKKQQEKSDGLIGGMQCLLRCNILDIYYKAMDRKFIYQWERDSLDKTFDAYKKINGNSFICDVMEQIGELPVKPN